MAWGWTSTRFLVGLLVACNLVAFLAIGALTARSLDAVAANEVQDAALVQAHDLAQQYRNTITAQVTAARDYLISGERGFLAEQDEAARKRRAVAQELAQRLPSENLKAAVQAAEVVGLRYDAYRVRSEEMKNNGAGGLEVVAFLREGRDLTARWREAQFALLDQVKALQERRREARELSVQQYRRLAVGATSAALLVAVALAIALVLRVLQPLQSLGVAAQRIAKGDVGVRVAVSGPDEFGQVGEAFNTMAAEVEASLTRLKAANEELRQLDKAKDEFLSVTSHELRTPLGFIKGFAGLLAAQMAGPLEGEQREYVGHIVSNADRMLLMINDLLDMATIRAGKLAISPSADSLSQLLEEAVAVARPAATQKELSLSLEAPSLAIAPVDASRLHQIMANLLGNAIKFTPAKGQVAVRLKAAGPFWRIEIQDSGPGVAEAERGKLFLRFSQLDMGDTRTVGGTGLGLYISKALTEAHGGRIGYAPAPEGGSIFWVELPAEAPPEGPKAAALGGLEA